MSAHEKLAEHGERRDAGVWVGGGRVPGKLEARRPVDLLPPLVQRLDATEVAELWLGSVLE